MAVVFRALVTVMLNLLSSSYLVLIDGLISFGGIYYLVHLYASNIKNAPEYYPLQFIGIVIPSYILIWIVSAYFSGSYEKPYRVVPIFRGIVVGTVLIAAFYGFLPDGWRFSRAIILLGGFYTGTVMLLTRLLYSLLRYQQFSFERVDNNRVIAIGSPAYTLQARTILQAVAPLSELVSEIDAPNANDVKNIAPIFKAKEIIFCADKLSYKEIITQIVTLGSGYDYKILSPGTDTLIGSNSKNNAGDLYAADVNLNLAKPIAQRQKRLLDVVLCLIILPVLPILALVIGGGLITNWMQVLLGRKTWVGYWSKSPEAIKGLPALRPAVIHQAQFELPEISMTDLRKLNYLYAKHYSISDDLGIVIRNIRLLGK